MILGTTQTLRNYKGFMYDGGHGGPYWIIGCLSAGTFQTISDLKRYIDENLWNCPSNAGG